MADEKVVIKSGGEGNWVHHNWVATAMDVFLFFNYSTDIW